MTDCEVNENFQHRVGGTPNPSTDAANGAIEGANHPFATKWPEVKFREKKICDKSESQRKRSSKSRLSNRRSTGFINQEDLAAAAAMGATGNT